MQFDWEQASAFVAGVRGDVASAVMDWRLIHDQDKSRPAHNARATLADAWQTLCDYNTRGYGVFAVANELDGRGRELENVAACHVHMIDLDNMSAMQNLQRARDWLPSPAWSVASSAGKAHVYWRVQPYRDNARYSTVQRKLNQLFDADRSVVDATRVMRVPGFFHTKADPVPVGMSTLPGWSVPPHDVLLLELALANVHAPEGGSGERRELGASELAAPSVEALQRALDATDPNTLNRGEWIAFTSAWKQAGWTLANDATLFNMWSAWCARYSKNDTGENVKQWRSIRRTEIGWPSVVNRVPGLRAMFSFGPEAGHVVPEIPEMFRSAMLGAGEPTGPAAPLPLGGDVPRVGDGSEILTAPEQAAYFAGCVYVQRFGEILHPDSGRLMNTTKFNATYGGKKFIYDTDGHTTDEAWKAATRGTVWRVPLVDHIRFLPTVAPGVNITDDLGRVGVNLYKPAIVKRQAGDVTPFLAHMERLLPVMSDREIYLRFLAHNVKFPGYKIPWSPLLQSAEGVGKGVIKAVIAHGMGGPYVHFPNAQELIESGSKFNAWMRNKLFILVDEIKVDERRDMIEVLKPFISETEIEIQGKGQDQDKEDNYSNWAFFSNYKDAIPVNQNGRRFAVFFSPLQTKADILDAGMNDAYFDALYKWVRSDGKAIVADWLMRWDMECGSIPMRAPDTSSTAEAIGIGRSPAEKLVLEAIADGLPGFRGGYVSSLAVAARMKADGLKPLGSRALGAVVEALGYRAIGRADRPYMQEGSIDRRAELWGLPPLRVGDVAGYGLAQGYGI